MSLGDGGIAASGEALSFKYHYVSDSCVGIEAKGQNIVAGTAEALLGWGIGVMPFGVTLALVDELEMLELLVVETEEEGGYEPISVAESAPVLNGKPGEKFAEIALQGRAVQTGGIVRGRVGGRRCVGRQRIVKSTAQPTACVVVGFLCVEAEFSEQFR